MRPGDELLLRGPAGAPFRVTVGVVFTAADIERRLASGEWRRLEAEAPATPGAGEKDAAPDAPATSTDPARPAQAASKAAWIAHVVGRGLLSAEDAANYTKADLIEIAS